MELAKNESNPVTRPLPVLVKLIREDLAKAAEAAHEAGMPYYKAAGEKLLEAKGSMPHGEFTAWVKRNIKVGYPQAVLYMKMVDTTRSMQNSSRAEYSSLNEFRREHQGYKQTVHPQPWHEPIKEAIGRINIDHLKQDALARQEERALQRKLALSLIDIGYKVLVKELHPDKGGSRDAMSRLNRVRDRLKQHA